MAYTPPAFNAANFTFGGATYTPPAFNAGNFTFGSPPPPPPPPPPVALFPSRRLADLTAFDDEPPLQLFRPRTFPQPPASTYVPSRAMILRPEEYDEVAPYRPPPRAFIILDDLMIFVVW